MPPFLPFALLSLLFWIVVIGGGFALAMRFVRAFERRGNDQRELSELRDKVARLEESIESVTNQVERVAEAQQFTTRLLSERKEGSPTE
jgi:prefoldin subunit 5